MPNSIFNDNNNHHGTTSLSAISTATLATITATLVATAATFAIVSIVSKNKRNKKEEENNNNTTDKVHDKKPFQKFVRITETDEVLLNLGWPLPINTITWFECNHDKNADDDNNNNRNNNLDEAYKQIQSRMVQIIQKNPWLQGKFIKFDGHYCIAYNDTSNNTSTTTKDDDDDENSKIDVSSSILSTMKENGMLSKIHPKDSKIFYGMPYDELCQNYVPYGLTATNDFDQPFWKVTLVPCSKSENNTRFAIIVSMSHIIGDGHSFYSLYNMLLGGKESKKKNKNKDDDPTKATTTIIRSLKIERVMNIDDLSAKHLNMTVFENAVAGLGIILDPIFRRIIRKSGVFGRLLFGEPITNSTRLFLVDQVKIEAIKKNEKGSHTYISTNDIITSWAMTKHHQQHQKQQQEHQNHGQVRHGFLIVNFRGRLEGPLDNDHVGNYANSLYYRIPNDVSTPADIRSSVVSMQRVHTAHQKISFWEMIWGDKQLVSNWENFATNNTHRLDCDDDDIRNDDEQFRELVHLPLAEVSELPNTQHMCVIFKARPGKIGVLLIGSPEEMKIRAPFESFEENLFFKEST